MIDWIKFSERRPEKPGQYLCFDVGGEFIAGLICEWSGLIRDGGLFLWHNKHGRVILVSPDYWAEINPPMEKESGVGPVMDVGLEMSKAFLKYTEEICREHNISLTTLEEIPKETVMPESQEAPKLCVDCRFAG